jgi:hypothetical protein
MCKVENNSFISKSSDEKNYCAANALLTIIAFGQKDADQVYKACLPGVQSR